MSFWLNALTTFKITGPADDVELREQDNESKPAPEGKHEFASSTYEAIKGSQCIKLIGSSDPFPMKL
jgi:hypothetical protein